MHNKVCHPESVFRSKDLFLYIDEILRYAQDDKVDAKNNKFLSKNKKWPKSNSCCTAYCTACVKNCWVTSITYGSLAIGILSDTAFSLKSTLLISTLRNVKLR